jgi:serine/threonine-protein kinase RsbW
MSTLEPELSLSIGSRFENIELVQVVIDDSLQRLRFAEDSRYWIGIAVREAVANAIQHGSRQDPEKPVLVDFVVEGAFVVIRVKDEGSGFDPFRVADPLDPENLLKPDGRGIFYMNRFMDDIEYNFFPGGGTVVTMRKAMAGAGSATTAAEEDRA